MEDGSCASAALKSNETNISAASERDCITLAVNACTLTACEQAVDDSDSFNVSNLFE